VVRTLLRMLLPRMLQRSFGSSRPRRFDPAPLKHVQPPVPTLFDGEHRNTGQFRQQPTDVVAPAQFGVALVWAVLHVFKHEHV